MLKKLSIAAAIALVAVSTAGAQDVAMKVVKGEEVVQRTRKVMHDVRWVNEFDRALAAAEKEGKLVFWLEIVGELDGGL